MYYRVNLCVENRVQVYSNLVTATVAWNRNLKKFLRK